MNYNLNIINVIIILFVFLNISVNIFWDGMIAFNNFGWLKHLCGNWDKIKKYFKVNHCERWISSINVSLMTVAGLILIIGIVKTGESSGVVEKVTESVVRVDWIHTFALCYVLARLILLSATILTTNLNEKWLSILPCASLQIFILSLILTNFSTDIFGEKSHKMVIVSYFVCIVLVLIIPFTILRIKPTYERESDVNLRFRIE